MGGPYERKAYQLELLLQRAGWSGVAEYDGSPRVVWLTEQLIERRDNHSDIERVSCL